MPEISTLMTEHNAEPSKRIPQHRLAQEVLSLVHSPQDAEEAAAQHAALFGRKPTASGIIDATAPSSTSTTPSDPTPSSATSSKSPPDMSNLLNKYAPITTSFNAPALNITLPRSLVHSQPMGRILYAAGLVASRSEGHRLCVHQGAYVGSRHSGAPMDDALNFVPCKNWAAEDTDQYIIDDALLILRVGKWKVKIVTIISDEEFEKRGLSCPGWEEHIGRKGEVAGENEGAELPVEEDEPREQAPSFKGHRLHRPSKRRIKHAEMEKIQAIENEERKANIAAAEKSKTQTVKEIQKEIQI